MLLLLDVKLILLFTLEETSQSRQDEVCSYHGENPEQQLMVISRRYAIARPSEYLLLTGAGIPDIRICKKAFVMPWQRVSI